MIDELIELAKDNGVRWVTHTQRLYVREATLQMGFKKQQTLEMGFYEGELTYVKLDDRELDTDLDGVRELIGMM